MANTELDAMASIDKALEALTDVEARARVLAWTWSKFAPKGIAAPRVSREAEISESCKETQSESGSPSALDLRKVCHLLDSGELRVTLRDLKAKSANDAAIRLAHIIVYCYQVLTKQTGVSSRKIVTPELKRWRLYNGNSRFALAKHKGIVRDEDTLMLDAHSTQDAENFIREALDPSVEGKWRI